MTGAYSHFIGMKHLGVFLLPLNGLLVHRRISPPSPQQYVTGTHLCTWVKREESILNLGNL